MTPAKAVIASAVSLAYVLSWAWLVTQLIRAEQEPEPTNAPVGEDNKTKGQPETNEEEGNGK